MILTVVGIWIAVGQRGGFKLIARIATGCWFGISSLGAEHALMIERAEELGA